MSDTKRVLFLYTELAPYFLACLDALIGGYEVEVCLVRWPLNQEAPFKLAFNPRLKVVDREGLSSNDLLQVYADFNPDVVLASGWVDKGYIAICKKARKDAIPTVMCSDTAWRGDLRQRFAVLSAGFWLHRTFSHAWVSGNAQAEYARKLGFPADRIDTGFYSADVPAFGLLAEKFLKAKAVRMPHVFLCVARYIPTKGHQYMCEAFAELCDEGEAQDWELICTGTGELHPMAFSHERIQHLGFVQPEDLPEVQANCGVFVLPSLYEPWGVVVQEHALAGFPLLLSDAVGARERFLVEHENGLLFDAGNKKSLKDMMRAIINLSDEELLIMGERSVEIGRSWNPDKWAGLLAEKWNNP